MIKILIDSYSNVMQHDGGGVQMRIGKFQQYFANEPYVESKLFNKWTDKLRDYQILHYFKASFESYGLFAFAKQEGLRIVLSSVIPQIQKNRIKAAILLNKVIPFQNSYSLRKNILQMSDAIVAQTGKEKYFIAKNYGIETSKIHIIPNGVNECILQNYNPNLEKDIVLCVGRFDHNKNQLSLIKAVKGLDIEVHFVGGKAIDDPSYFTQCVTEAKDSHNIVFHGWIENSSEEFLSLYRRARVVALLSHNEIFGNSLIEGGACGANLVTTNVLPVEEYGFGPNCISVDPESIESIRQGIVNAYNMPLSSSVHDIVKERFSWENIVRQHIHLYQSLL